MKILVLYRPDSEHGRQVEGFIRDFERIHTTMKLEAVNIDTRDGAALASLYDIMQYPGILALADDGSVLKNWQGQQLPLMDEVASYSYA